MSIDSTTEQFETVDAPQLAKRIGVTTPWKGRASAQFLYFADADRFLIVAPDTSDVELALAIGLHHRGTKKLVLALPAGRAFTTLQRAPWLTADAQPDIRLYGGKRLERKELPTTEKTIRQLKKRLKKGQTFAQELQYAATPAHLGSRSATVYALVEWATTNPMLDPSHRRGERAWQCMGQKVLSIRRTRGGLTIGSGIHYSTDNRAHELLLETKDGLITDEQLQLIKDQTNAGIKARLKGSATRIHRPDEHWLQAVIRRNPSLVGVEQPALRELPSWRPNDSPEQWSRGYIDLVGVDGHGDVRIVETKLSDNKDHMLILQGLDYYIWAKAYQDTLREKLGVTSAAAFEIHYVIGDTTKGDIHYSPFAAAQAASLADEIPWRFQTIHDWYQGPAEPTSARSALLPPRTLP
jgi:hypothetical protein